MSDLQSEIAARVAGFVDEIGKLARQAAMNALSSALQAPTGATQRPGRRSAAALPVAPSSKRAKGEKRSSEDIARIAEDVQDFVQRNPGQRAETIKAALGLTKADLTLPMRKLLAAGALRSEGIKRATAYFPGKGSPAGTGSPKRGRKKN
jgi:hypothetical protein